MAYHNVAKERGAEKVLEHKDDGSANCNWCTWNKGLEIRVRIKNIQITTF